MSGIRFQKKKISAEERGSADEDHGGDKIKYGNGSGNRSPLVKTKIQRSVVCYLKDLFSTTTTKISKVVKRAEWGGALDILYWMFWAGPLKVNPNIKILK